MTRLHIDFLHPYPRSHFLGWLLLLAGIVLVSWTVWNLRQLDISLTEESAKTRQFRPAGSTSLVPRRAETADQSEVLSAAEQLKLPWSDLFVNLEKVQSSRIALLSLEADSRKTEATLTAEAKNLREMLAYIERLKKDAGFKSVVLSSHALREEDPQLPVRFVLRVQWRG